MTPAPALEPLAREGRVWDVWDYARRLAGGEERPV